MLAITTGEPSGIGPDICLDIATSNDAAKCVLIGCKKTLEHRATQLGKTVAFVPWQPGKPPTLPNNSLWIIDTPVAEPVVTGQLNTANGRYVINTLDIAIDGCKRRDFSGIVTAPVQKSVINDAGIPFSGHTEYLAESTDCEKVVMMLANDDLRVALVTTHLPLNKISEAVTYDNVAQTLRIVHNDLSHTFGIDQPRISVCGLNPHAGEDGHLGMEEINTIQPCINNLRSNEGLNLSDALPADTAFTKKALVGVDAVVAMYHDQGLPVVKSQGFGEVVNITLGLPIVRTSVDHGTALDLAGTGNASSTSLFSAIRCAMRMHARSTQ